MALYDRQGTSVATLLCARFQASTSSKWRPLLVDDDRYFGTGYRSHRKGFNVIDLRNIPEDRGSQHCYLRVKVKSTS